MNLAAIFPITLLIYLFFKNIKRPLLAFFYLILLTIVIHAIAHLSINNQGFLHIAVALFVHATPLYLLAGPSYFLFIRYSIGNKPIHWLDGLHLVPFVVQLISITPYLIIPIDEKLIIVQNIINDPTLQKTMSFNLLFSTEFGYFFRSIHFLCYLIFGLILIRKEEGTSAIAQKSLIALKRISWVLISLILVYSIHITLVAYGDNYRNWLINLAILTDFILFTILFIELAQYPELLYDSKKLRRGYLKESPFINAKQSQEQLPKEIYQAIETKIHSLSVDKKFFGNPQSNFDSFARAIGHSKYHIRSFLKMKNTSFMAMKNQSRIQMAQELLKSQRHYKIEYIAQKSGFDSLSNFFKIFKKSNNCTPDEYRKMMLASRD